MGPNNEHELHQRWLREMQYANSRRMKRADKVLLVLAVAALWLIIIATVYGWASP
ncbi:MAG: hypothetical protein OEV88_17090 [Gammaproteobacteria bacterium]|nr:hypothetical protein [Gammaproteobacteria bacterium]